jgi:hydrogenase maturation protease
MNTLILGIGNLLLCDEGVGVHAARALAQRTLPANVSVVEAGTAFLDVLPEIEKADRILLLDAMEGGAAPGTLYRVPFDECVHPDMLASSRVLFMAGNNRTPEVIVFGIEPARIEWGTELSPAVQRVIPAVQQAILNELNRGTDSFPSGTEITAASGSQ